MKILHIFLHFTVRCTDERCNSKIRGEVLKYKHLPDPKEFGLNIILYLFWDNNVQHLLKKRFGGICRQEISEKFLETSSNSFNFSLYRKKLANQLSKDLFDAENPLLPRLGNN